MPTRFRTDKHDASQASHASITASASGGRPGPLHRIATAAPAANR